MEDIFFFIKENYKSFAETSGDKYSSEVFGGFTLRGN